MTLDEARKSIGAGVVYRPDHGPAEDGTITDVRGRWVHVLYAGDRTAKATAPDQLAFLAGGRHE